MTAAFLWCLMHLRWPRQSPQNAEWLAAADVPIAGSSLAHWRRRIRAEIVGHTDVPIVVTGHQPAMIHAGVWAKHVVATRLARAVGGLAVNLVVDNDAPRHHGAADPTPDG